jgi:DNA phosphorothioation-associated putative methyltransferase
MLSRPVARALEDAIIADNTSVLDYGCGRGGDVARLERLGIQVCGFDPVYQPKLIREACDVVNLGYVINVIESVVERHQTLRRAWALARSCLVVAARLRSEAREIDATARLGDGYVTSAGTFQKFFTQAELRGFVEDTLQQPAVAAAPGVFYVFRNPSAEQSFLARRIRRRVASRSKLVFERRQELLTSLVAFVEERGRLPRDTERGGFAALEEELGSVRNAFAFIRRVTGDERWDRIRVARSEDVLVYLALSRFGRRPRIGELPQELQHDIKDLFGSYQAGCAQADRLLFAVSDRDRVQAAIQAAGVGKRTRDALYVHISALVDLVPVLRVLEGCARALLGTVDDATLVKFRADSPLISYLGYPGFDREPHPALQFAYTVDLATLRIDYRDYSHHSNPPILHRKELFLSEGHPHRELFARLTRQEVRHGLYREPERIGTRRGWAEALALRGVELRGHRVVPVSAAD